MDTGTKQTLRLRVLPRLMYNFQLSQLWNLGSREEKCDLTIKNSKSVGKQMDAETVRARSYAFSTGSYRYRYEQSVRTLGKKGYESSIQHQYPVGTGIEHDCEQLTVSAISEHLFRQSLPGISRTRTGTATGTGLEGLVVRNKDYDQTQYSNKSREENTNIRIRDCGH